MRRIFPVLVSLVLVFSLIAVPAWAAEPFVFEYDDSFEAWVSSVDSIPSGSYNLTIVDRDSSFSSISPFDLNFERAEDSGGNAIFYASSSVDFEGGFLPTVQVVYSDGLSIIGCEGVGSVTAVYYLIPCVDEAPSLSGVIDSEMMSGVLDQVVSLLPVVLVTIVAFIATRKGISFLRGFLAGS